MSDQYELEALRGIVSEMASNQAPYQHPHDHCYFCKTQTRKGHSKACVWRRARELLGRDV